MHSLADFAAVLVPVYVCVAGGFLWARMGRPIDLSFVATFVYVVGAPPLVFAALKRAPEGSVPLGTLAEAAVFAVALGGLLAALVSIAAGRRLGASGGALALPFAGAMGLSVLRDALGPAAFAQGIAYFAVATLVASTVGRAAARGRWDGSSLFGSPIAWGMAGALVLVALPWTPPKFLLNTTNLLGGVVVPVMLIASGVALGRVEGTDLLRALPSGSARLGIGLIAGFVVAGALGLDGVSRIVVVLESAMPIAFLWPIYAKGGWNEFAASLAVGLAALPLLVAYLI